jgi:protein-L-isoaspartate(D-aspartate) O-methyltransferase
MVEFFLKSRGITDPRVLAAMRDVRREYFLPEDLASLAYDDRPLPIGHGQTISQPYMVAYMTELLRLKEGDRVLEIGTGSGYQAAVLATIVEHVYSVEIVEELAEEARWRLDELGYANVTVRTGDGYHGWPEQAPYDGIIVTAAARSVPKPLVQQMKPGSRMVIPLGEEPRQQVLVLVEKHADGTVTHKKMLPVRFVPFTGDHP